MALAVLLTASTLSAASRPEVAQAAVANRLNNAGFEAVYDSGTYWEADEWMENNLSLATAGAPNRKFSVAAGQTPSHDKTDGTLGSIYTSTGGQTGTYAAIIYPDPAYTSNPPVLTQEVPASYLAGRTPTVSGSWYRTAGSSLDVKATLMYATTCSGNDSTCKKYVDDADCPANKTCGTIDSTTCDTTTTVAPSPPTWGTFSVTCGTLPSDNIWDATLVLEPTGTFATGKSIAFDDVKVDADDAQAYQLPSWTTDRTFTEMPATADIIGVSKQYDSSNPASASAGVTREVYAVKSDGSGDTRLTTLSAGTPNGHANVVVNPVDHTQVAAARYTYDWDYNDELNPLADPMRVYVLDLALDKDVPITPTYWNAGLGGVEWTTDGRYIVFGVNGGRYWELWKADTQSTPKYALSPVTTHSYPSTANTTYTSTTATDSSATWGKNQWTGFRVSQGSNTAMILSNTATQLTLESAWAPSTPSSGSTFTITGAACYESDVNTANYSHWVTYRRSPMKNGNCYAADQKGQAVAVDLDAPATTGTEIWSPCLSGLAEDGLPFGAYDPGFMADDLKIILSASVSDGSATDCSNDPGTADSYDTATVNTDGTSYTKLFGEPSIQNVAGDWTWKLAPFPQWNTAAADDREAVAYDIQHDDSPLGYTYWGMTTFNPNVVNPTLTRRDPYTAGSLDDNGIGHPRVIVGGHHSATANNAPGGAGTGFDSNPTNAYAKDGAEAGASDARNESHTFYTFGLEKSVPQGSGTVIDGIRVRFKGARVDVGGATPYARAALSWDGGFNWTAQQTVATAGGATTWTDTAQDFIGGAPADTWGRSWLYSEMAALRVNLEFKCVTSCPTKDWFLDHLDVRVYWHT